MPLLHSAEVPAPSESISSSPEGASSGHSLHHTNFTGSHQPPCVSSKAINQQCLTNMNWNKLLDLFQYIPSTFGAFTLEHSQPLLYSNLVDYLQTFRPFTMWLLDEHSKDSHGLYIMGAVAGVVQYLISGCSHNTTTFSVSNVPHQM